jgi:transposase-like protein
MVFAGAVQNPENKGSGVHDGGETAGMAQELSGQMLPS